MPKSTPLFVTETRTLEPGLRDGAKQDTLLSFKNEAGMSVGLVRALVVENEHPISSELTKNPVP